jgi:hypothetical protein
VDGTFGNRFDDPTGSPDPLGVRRVLPSDMRFRTLYCSTSPVGAFGETIARFRTSTKLWAELQKIDDYDAPDPTLIGGVVPVGSRMQRRLGIAALDQSLRFVDIAAPETRAR